MEEQLKEIKQPLGLYDLFGYLLPGFFFYALFIIDFDGSKIMRYFMEKHTLAGIENEHFNFKLKFFLDFIFYDSKLGLGIIPFLIFLIFCYLTGHVMASFSSFLAKHFIKRFMKHPTENLFPDYIHRENRGKLYNAVAFIYRGSKKIIGGLLSLNYKRPFDPKFIEKFKARIDDIYKYEVSRADYYWLTYAYICANHSGLVRRVQHFVNLAGFARNVTGTFIFYFFMRFTLFSGFLNCVLDKSVWLVMAGFASIMLIMFWTYLRLHKRQAVDMYYIFMSLKIKAGE
jgi:hypothetical protein